MSFCIHWAASSALRPNDGHIHHGTLKDARLGSLMVIHHRHSDTEGAALSPRIAELPEALKVTGCGDTATN